MDVSRFDFDLPDSAIALRPAEPRDTARLLHIGDTLQDCRVADLPSLLRAGDLLVLNETKVIPAALSAIRPARLMGGGGDVSLTINLHTKVDGRTWRAFIRPAKRLRVGDDVIIADDFSATVIDIRSGGDVALRFQATGKQLDEKIAPHGAPPLPPYIARQRPADERDSEDYQTVFAKDPGSVAAPTAGLHFTPDLFTRLGAAGIEIARLTLHVGAGTFLPVKSENTDDHIMHSEWFEIDEMTAEQINRAKSTGRRIIAVGTTALRAIESAAEDGRVTAAARETDIFITPGYTFKIIDGLMTNFHLPRSTLFMLVSAVAGLDVMRDAYAHAIRAGYRFYSYGDSSLIWMR